MRELQLAPFPFDLMMRELRRYPNAQLMWVQEEPLNMGAFNHVSPRIETCMRHEVRTRCLPISPCHPTFLQQNLQSHKPTRGSPAHSASLAVVSAVPF